MKYLLQYKGPEKWLIDNSFNLEKAICDVKLDNSGVSDQDALRGGAGYLKNFWLKIGDVEKIMMNLKNKQSTEQEKISTYYISKKLPKLFSRILTLYLMNQ